jgi:hypothetical protein
MHVIAEKGAARYVQLVLSTPEDFQPPFESEPYTCLLWDTQGEATVEARAALARCLIESGWVYVSCGGATCEQWHDQLTTDSESQL